MASSLKSVDPTRAYPAYVNRRRAVLLIAIPIVVLGVAEGSDRSRKTAIKMALLVFLQDKSC